MAKRRQFLLGLLVITFLGLFAVRNIFLGGFYNSHDGILHSTRIANYFLALKTGNLPPTLAPKLYGGLGYPIFIFIYPLPYLIASIPHFAGISYTLCFQIFTALPYVLSGIFMYWFIYVLSRKVPVSIISSILFLYAPYRFLLLYVRGAFAENFAYVFVPLSFLCLLKVIKTKSYLWWGLLTLSLAGLLLSHQLVALMFLPIITWFFIYEVISQKLKPTDTKFYINSLLLAFGIAAFIYLPVFFERSYLIFDQALNYYQDHFITLGQFIHSKWDYWYSNPGTADDGMSFELGFLHLITLGTTTLFILLGLSNRKSFVKKRLYPLIFWFIPAIMVTFLMLDAPIVYKLWQIIPLIKTIDFPWRMLGVVVFITSILSIYVSSLLPRQKLLTIAVIIAALAINWSFMKPEGKFSISDKELEAYPESGTAYNEFLPNSRQTETWEHNFDTYKLLQGKAQITLLNSKLTKINLSINAQEPTTIIFSRLYFPGWRLFIDDANASIKSLEYTSEFDQNYSGLITATIPAGNHQVSLLFTKTPVRFIGLFITGFSTIITLMFVFFPRSTQKIIQSNS